MNRKKTNVQNKQKSIKEEDTKDILNPSYSVANDNSDLAKDIKKYQHILLGTGDRKKKANLFAIEKLNEYKNTLVKDGKIKIKGNIVIVIGPNDIYESYKKDEWERDQLKKLKGKILSRFNKMSENIKLNKNIIERNNQNFQLNSQLKSINENIEKLQVKFDKERRYVGNIQSANSREISKMKYDASKTKSQNQLNDLMRQRDLQSQQSQHQESLIAQRQNAEIQADATLKGAKAMQDAIVSQNKQFQDAMKQQSEITRRGFEQMSDAQLQQSKQFQEALKQQSEMTRIGFEQISQAQIKQGQQFQTGLQQQGQQFQAGLQQLADATGVALNAMNNGFQQQIAQNNQMLSNQMQALKDIQSQRPQAGQTAASACGSLIRCDAGYDYYWRPSENLFRCNGGTHCVSAPPDCSKFRCY